ncbi:helix-turn-helix transcriptional regulator [uncultured Merdimmobilis sp.]|uniref:helix-turn-helix domain-containing protein n=1 Tax=uncultured Merdimmobilis sp. TaxID=3028859 RepID=UPI002805279A|nr:helix-turn-helix transcriptional regulator [uncultured Merdimmobilis sp.]
MADENRNSGLGFRVRALRENLGLSKKQLADLCYISESQITEIEKGRKGVFSTSACRLAKALGTTTDFLLLGRGSLSDMTKITTILSTLEPPLVEAAEKLLKDWFYSINLARHNETVLPSNLKEEDQ